VEEPVVVEQLQALMQHQQQELEVAAVDLKLDQQALVVPVEVELAQDPVAGQRQEQLTQAVAEVVAVAQEDKLGDQAL
jgi:hypothetical protein